MEIVEDEHVMLNTDSCNSVVVSGEAANGGREDPATSSALILQSPQQVLDGRGRNSTQEITSSENTSKDVTLSDAVSDRGHMIPLNASVLEAFDREYRQQHSTDRTNLSENDYFGIGGASALKAQRGDKEMRSGVSIDADADDSSSVSALSTTPAVGDAEPETDPDLDLCNPKQGEQRVQEITPASQTQSDLRERKRMMMARVAFIGFSDNFDEWVECKGARMAPLNSKSGGARGESLIREEILYVALRSSADEVFSHSLPSVS